MLIALKATPFQLTDKKIRKIIVGVINASQRINYAVLLGLDGVYRDGEYIKDESHLVVPNDYVMFTSCLPVQASPCCSIRASNWPLISRIGQRSFPKAGDAAQDCEISR